MRLFSFYWIMSCCLLSVSLLRGEEQLFFLLDDRKWQMGFQDQPPEGTIIELILPDEQITNWTELFTLQAFKDIPISADEFIPLLKESTQQHLPKDQKLRFQMMRGDPFYIFESSYLYPASSSAISYDEYNIGRILKGKSTLYYLRYSTKKANLFAKDLDDWIKRLEQAYLADTPRAKQQGNWLKLTSKGKLYKEDQLLTLQSHERYIYDTEKGFGITFPQNWHVKAHTAETLVEDPLYQINLSFSDPKQHMEGNLALLENPLASFKPRVETVKAFKKQHADAKVIGKGTLHTILGQEGTYVLLAHDNKIGWITFFHSEDQVYRLAIWAKRQQFNALKTEIEKVMLNFQVAVAEH